MKPFYVMAAILSVLLGSCSCSAVRQTEEDSIAERDFFKPIGLDPGTTYQTIAGFGTTGCWWSEDVGGWEQDKVDQIVRLLFNRQTGIGLNIYRFEVGGGEINEVSDPWRRAETFEISAGQYDWQRQKNAVAVMRQAVREGVDTVMFFANTPPGRLTVNGRTTGGDKGKANLTVGLEDEFARYLVDIAIHFRDEGIPVRYISPINEPQWSWQLSNGQEGCHYAPEQIRTVAAALVAELASRAPDIRPSLIDSGKWLDRLYTIRLYEELARMPDVGPAMDHFAAHSYWANEADKKTTRSLLDQTGVQIPLWQTEWCQMESGRDLGMAAALTLARCVHEDLTILDCQAWISWLAVSRYDYKDGLIYVVTDSRSVLESRRLWALGNYSRFIQPGYARIQISGDTGHLLVSAFASPTGDRQVVVVVNPGNQPAGLNVQSSGLSRYEAFETSAEHALELVASGKAGPYKFPPESITTLVLQP